MMRVIRKYYPSGVYTVKEFNNYVLEELAERAEELLRKGYNPARVAFKLNLTRGVFVEHTGNTITLIDTNLDQEGNSRGPERIEIVIRGQLTLAEQLIKDTEAIGDSDIWEVVECRFGNGALFWGFLFGQEDVPREITGVELKKRITSFVETVKDKGMEDGIGRGAPLVSTSLTSCTWSYGHEEWRYEFSGDRFGLQNYYLAPCGCGYRLVWEYVLLRRKK